jgi:uncharacterized protein (TIGR01777 family)
MNKTVLITGGSGLIGTNLSELLIGEGYNVNHLSRTKTGKEKYKTFTWDIEKGVIESEAVQSADYIVHLAGANIAAKRWTDKRKKKILESRTESSDLIYSKLAEGNHHVKAVISASGVGIYGAYTGDTLLTEESNFGNDFLAEVSKKWEAGIERIQTLGIRVVRLRIGIVLAKEGGALPKLLQPIKFGVGAPLGSGNQYYSWIHIYDLCRIFQEAIKNESMQGAYNAVAPNPLTNKDFTKVLASKVGRPLILPNIPSFAMKMILGELSNMVLGGNKVSSKKIKSEGFKFTFNDFGEALENILMNKKKNNNAEVVETGNKKIEIKDT